MISIAMAFYNGKKYIKDQIYSILENMQKKDELIISVDDDSDGSREILTELSQKDDRIHIIKGPGKGVVSNFQNAINHCKKNNSKLHIMGLLSDGGVHSSLEHFKAVLKLCYLEKFENDHQKQLKIFGDPSYNKESALFTLEPIRSK